MYNDSTIGSMNAVILNTQPEPPQKSSKHCIDVSVIGISRWQATMQGKDGSAAP
jgi:hypothetical protein